MAERILLVEDEEKLARMVELELQYEGYEVEKVRCCDMFGWTTHVETVIALHRKNM